MIKKRNNSDWHLYSAFAITVTLVTISAIFFKGTPQVLGITLSTTLVFIFQCEWWKNQPIETHKFITIISLIVFLLSIIIPTILIYFGFFDKNKKTL